jgi:hypothetical protein
MQSCARVMSAAAVATVNSHMVLQEANIASAASHTRAADGERSLVHGHQLQGVAGTTMWPADQDGIASSGPFAERQPGDALSSLPHFFFLLLVSWS